MYWNDNIETTGNISIIYEVIQDNVTGRIWLSDSDALNAHNESVSYHKDTEHEHIGK